MSAILRPRGDAGGNVAGVLASVAGDLARFAGERHVVYDASNLHTTLRTLDSTGRASRPETAGSAGTSRL